MTNRRPSPILLRARKNRIMLVISAILGAIIGFGLSLGIGSHNSDVLFGDGGIPLWMAIVICVLTLIIIPAMSWYWHKAAIDEQEEAAYKSGALIAIYAFWFISPAWWALYKAGLVGPVNGPTPYFLTTYIAGAIGCGRNIASTPHPTLMHPSLIDLSQ